MREEKADLENNDRYTDDFDCEQTLGKGVYILSNEAVYSMMKILKEHASWVRKLDTRVNG
jgi:hypothetical protein